MSIECYNNTCNFHNKMEPFCNEVECHCENGNKYDIIYKDKASYVVRREDLTCFTCTAYSKCEWRDDPYSIDGDCLAEK